MNKIFSIFIIFILVIYATGHAKVYIPDGPRKSFYDSGQLQAHWDYSEGTKDGMHKEYFKNGKLKSECMHKSGVPFGHCKTYYENGQLNAEHYYGEKGGSEGISKRYYENGAVAWIWNHDPSIKKNNFISYFETGEVKQEQDKLNGRTKETRQYNKKGSLLWKLHYDESSNQTAIYFDPDGKRKDGVYKEYFDRGQLKAETHYKDGIKGLQKQFYENGTFKTAHNNGKVLDENGNLINGLHKVYYDNGKIQSEINYTNGEQDGLYKLYYENGQIKIDGKVKGFSLLEHKKYDENGTLVSDSTGQNNLIDQ